MQTAPKMSILTPIKLNIIIFYYDIMHVRMFQANRVTIFGFKNRILKRQVSGFVENVIAS